MRCAAVAVFAAALVASAQAYCPNGCSGHGTCSATGGDKDRCTCYQHLDEGVLVDMWTGADCSLRTCPLGGGWATSPTGNNDHVSTKQECSTRGKCDRTTGNCMCIAGYTGAACQRTACPNDCNGHGTCQSLAQFADDVSHDSDSGGGSALFAVPNSEKDCANCWGTPNAGAQYSKAWDATRSIGCKCDAGFAGADCSVKECPSGDDILGGNGGSKGRACSGRGKCDTTNGECQCFHGYYGNRCQYMSIIA